MGGWSKPAACLVVVLASAGVVLAGSAALAQQKLSAEAGAEAKTAIKETGLAPLPERHRFWDRTNVALFAGVGTVHVLDFTSTRYFRARGYSEGLLTNQIVDNQPLFASIEVAATSSSIAVSYWFHRKNHHRLERWVSLIHIGAGTVGAARNYRVKGLPPGALRP